MQKTNTEWADFSANPLKYRDPAGEVVWACIKTSPGCLACYAETLAHRYGRGGPFTRGTMEGLTPFLDEKELRSMLTCKPASGKRVFVGDMTDWAGEWVPNELLDRLFAVLGLRQDVTWMLLTKRAERMQRYMTRLSESINPLETAARAMGRTFKFTGLDGKEHSLLPFPLPSVWLGVSVEDQQRADERIPHLLQTPAAVRFLSCEPLLSAVDLRHVHHDGLVEIDALTGDHGVYRPLQGRSDARIHWVIIGGESGPQSRPFQLDWARSIQSQCDAANVPWFFKQAGSNPMDWDRGDPANYRPSELIQLKFRDRKGGDLNELPSSLRVRYFPEVAEVTAAVEPVPEKVVGAYEGGGA